MIWRRGNFSENLCGAAYAARRGGFRRAVLQLWFLRDICDFYSDLNLNAQNLAVKIDHYIAANFPRLVVFRMIILFAKVVTVDPAKKTARERPKN